MKSNNSIALGSAVVVLLVTAILWATGSSKQQDGSAWLADRDNKPPSMEPVLSMPSVLPTVRSPLESAPSRNRIEGTVVHEGQPICDAIVAHDAYPVKREVDEGGSVATGNDGAFTITGLTERTYQLRITREGYASTTILAEPGMSLRIELQRTRIDGVIEGALVDTAGVPITEFAISALRARRGGWVSLLNAKPVASPNGVFREPVSLPSPENELSIVFSASGFRDKRMSCSGLGAGSRLDLGTVVVERFTGGVEGQVVSEHEGMPISNATVVPISTGGRLENEVRTDSSGMFSVDRVSENQLVGFAASADGYAPVYIQLPESLDPGQPVVIRLGRGAEIYGSVVMTDAGPVRGLMVGYWLDEGESVLPGLPTLISSIESVGEGGEYRIRNVPSKPLLVGVVKPSPTRMPPLVEFLRLTVVHCAEGEKRMVDFVLGEGVTVSATLIAGGRTRMTALSASLLANESTPIAVVQCTVGASITFRDVEPGKYVLRIASRPKRFTDMDIVVSGAPVALGELDVSACFSP